MNRRTHARAETMKRYKFSFKSLHFHSVRCFLFRCYFLRHHICWLSKYHVFRLKNRKHHDQTILNGTNRSDFSTKTQEKKTSQENAKCNGNAKERETAPSMGQWVVFALYSVSPIEDTLAERYTVLLLLLLSLFWFPIAWWNRLSISFFTQK